MNRRIGALLLASAGAGFLVGNLTSAGFASSVDPAVIGCGLGTSISATFEIAEARHFWRYLPAARRAPELEEDTSPASVVVYDGPVNALVFGQAGMQVEGLNGAVCVLLENGDRHVYANVSRSGFETP